MAIDVTALSDAQFADLLARGEGHFLDFKAKEVSPAKLTKSLSAFANADGGELFIGVLNSGSPTKRWSGFVDPEAANGHIQAFEEFFPLGSYFKYQFLKSDRYPGLLLHCEILKTPDIRSASDKVFYLRRGAQNLPQTQEDQISRLKFNKGITSYEDHIVKIDVAEVTNSKPVLEFMLANIPTAEPLPWLKKQQLIDEERPTVAAVLLYAEEPQAALPKAGIKIYRYQTSGSGTRDTLVGNPSSIEGHAYALIAKAVQATVDIVEKVSVIGTTGLEKVSYPRESIHEIITNAVLHRDYSLNDDIHIRIYDNRIEVQSPGVLPAHVTVENILEERFARNQRIVRLINKYEDPPNKDVGEGLNTAFEAMRKLKFRDPVIEQLDGSVKVTLRHEKLASPEELICEYLRVNSEINNAKAREITFIGSENSVKRIFNKMMKSKIIERIPDRPQAKTGYRKGSNFPSETAQ
ncbi:ATP-binding protein [Bradyrhizobium guangzhouense]|uniref:ATP-dependent DNA helicase RecG n=1 Tax=Bradyrhizobium guangzhouense TaxID=1325095 RepID=A0AAE6C8N8_9BRAD|nr:ATP-binding protein [Bradyrhizobium guangzhouense]QAU46943.1 ATP-dependent DNA helicase RecG [Bradyrhizobium guangzhouense]RXH12953.1 ATP-dependent DNA helicase RecG [Bradyrhizobium guangzhouense]